MRRSRLRFTVRRMMFAVAIAGIILAFAKALFIDNRPGDILIAAICALEGHFTVYAKGYGESKFRSLRVEMTVRQVEEIMGPPLARRQWQVPDGRGGPVTAGEGVLNETWYFSRAGKARGNYWRREVRFRNRVVYRIDSLYYVD
jgi:hypothetical protein